MLASLLGFAAIAAFYLCGRLGRAAYWVYRKLFPPRTPERERLLSPERRHFLARTAVAVSATPFAACAYGMLYERTEIETTHQRIVLRRLPKAFDGFRIAQLSDIHIGPFMPVEEIRKYVAMVNQLKPDLVALTGDFVTWEGSPAANRGGGFVRHSRRRSAFSVAWAIMSTGPAWRTPSPASSPSAEPGCCATQNAAIESAGERLNLIGVDYQTRAPFGPPRDGIVKQYLEGVRAAHAARTPSTSCSATIPTPLTAPPNSAST